MHYKTGFSGAWAACGAVLGGIGGITPMDEDSSRWAAAAGEAETLMNTARSVPLLGQTAKCRSSACWHYSDSAETVAGVL